MGTMVPILGGAWVLHVIARPKLIEFWEKHKDAEQSLKAWFKEAQKANWKSPKDIRKEYTEASFVGSERVVFNICRNDYRLVVRINYKSGAVFIRFVGTHKEYDKIDVETI